MNTPSDWTLGGRLVIVDRAVPLSLFPRAAILAADAFGGP